MQKKISMLLAALITLSMLAAIVPVKGSTGNILINVKTPPSPVVTIKLGGSVNLYFGKVTWSGGTIDLYISTNGYAALNYTTDTKYGPTFSVAKLTSATIDTTTYEGYSIGNNWINGTIPTSLEIPGGHYYVKAFDGITAAVAVTDNYINIIASFEVVVVSVPYNYPKSGPGQASIQLKGYALPANDYANLSYNAGAGWVVIKDLYPANAKGRFVYAMTAPDLKKALPAGHYAEMFDTITFRMIVNSTGQTETDIFKEYYRGLKQVKGVNEALALAGELYGNLTDFGPTPYPGVGPHKVSTINVEVLGSLIIAGRWFHPGSLTILWDRATAVGTATANATGWFNTTVTVPITSKGEHNVTIDEAKDVFIIYINVVPTLILVPDTGPVGTSVTAYGYGFPASTSTTLYKATLWWDYVDSCNPVPVNLTATPTSSLGQFTVGFTVPHTVGGAHIVTAITNDSALTSASDTFTVVPDLIMTSTSFLNDGAAMWVNGTGLASGTYYDLCLDNSKDFYAFDLFTTTVAKDTMRTGNVTAGTLTYFIADCIGDFSFRFVAAGFQPGLHVVSLYKANPNVAGPAGYLPTLDVWELFNVTTPEENLIITKLDQTLEKLDSIDESIAGVSDLVKAEGAHLDAVKASLLDAIAAARGDITNVRADISGLSATLTSIETYASTAATKATEAAASASTAASQASDASTAAKAAQSTASGISTAVYGAIVLSLIAALASIVAVITLQRKVAG